MKYTTKETLIGKQYYLSFIQITSYNRFIYIEV